MGEDVHPDQPVIANDIAAVAYLHQAILEFETANFDRIGLGQISRLCARCPRCRSPVSGSPASGPLFRQGAVDKKPLAPVSITRFDLWSLKATSSPHARTSSALNMMGVKGISVVVICETTRHEVSVLLLTFEHR